MKKPVCLATIKEDELLKNMDLVRLARLSVGTVKEFEFDRIIALSETKL